MLTFVVSTLNLGVKGREREETQELGVPERVSSSSGVSQY